MTLPALWRISLVSALLGLGQNGLLVALPVLVAQFGLPLSQWASLILLGSMLFLVGSPAWGRVADRRGPRLVVIQALLGYMASFGVIGLALWWFADGGLPQSGLLIMVALARVLYGLTVSGMVPACQQWALGLQAQHGETRRVAALATISAGLSGGRLLGPLVTAASLSLSIYAPFAVMLLAGLLALALLKGVPQPACADAARNGSRSLPALARLAPYLGMAILLALSVSLLQLGLPDALQRRLTIDATQASHWMGILLSLSALGALAVQLTLVRSQRLGAQPLMLLGGLGLTSGYAILLYADGLGGFGLGVLIASIGAALAVPGYTAAATHQRSQGSSAGWLAMGHTLGYGAATLAVNLVAAPGLLTLALAAALGLLALWLLSRGFHD